jgi:hypothetical protein
MAGAAAAGLRFGGGDPWGTTTDGRDGGACGPVLARRHVQKEDDECNR